MFSNLWQEHLKPSFENLGQNLKDFSTNVGNLFSDLWQNHLKPSFENLGQNLKDFSSNVGKWFTDLWQDHLKPSFESIGDWFSHIFTSLGDILSYINPFSENFFGHKLVELFKDLLNFLFVPDEEYFEKIKNNWDSHFTFIDSIKEAVSSIKNMIDNISAAPKFVLHIKQNSLINEGDYTILDLSWYAPYKNYGDLVLTGFLYILFFWNLFKHIPKIIDGFGLVGSHTDDD